MILTLTPNPAVDQTIFVHHLAVGEVNRFHESQFDPAGKGVNVSRMAHRLGWPTVAFGFLGGEIGRLAQLALEQEGVQHHFVPVSGQTRLNVTVVDEQTGRATSLYGPGAAVAAGDLSTLEGLLEFWLPASRVLVLAGSLPPGAPETLHAEYIRLAHAKGVKTFLDADDTPFRLGLEAKPYLIKPNVAEAERLVGRTLPDLASIIDAARDLAAHRVSVAVISMGAQGAVCADGEHVWFVTSPRVEARSTVGSGDSFVAGLAVALARGDDLMAGLRLGAAAGAATAMTAGTALGTAEAVEQLVPHVRIETVA